MATEARVLLNALKQEQAEREAWLKGFEQGLHMEKSTVESMDYEQFRSMIERERSQDLGDSE